MWCHNHSPLRQNSFSLWGFASSPPDPTGALDPEGNFHFLLTYFKWIKFNSMHRSPIVCSVVLCHLSVSKYKATERRMLFPNYYMYIKLGVFNVFFIFKVCRNCVRKCRDGHFKLQTFPGVIHMNLLNGPSTVIDRARLFVTNRPTLKSGPLREQKSPLPLIVLVCLVQLRSGKSVK